MLPGRAVKDDADVSIHNELRQVWVGKKAEKERKRNRKPADYLNDNNKTIKY